MLDLSTDINRRTYERTVRMIALAAIQRLYPGQKVRVEYSVSSGVFIRLPGKHMTQRDIVELEKSMHQIVSEDLLISQEKWDPVRAEKYFADCQRIDVVALLRSTKPEWVEMTCCDGYWDDCYGETLSTTGEASVFALIGNFPGFVIQLPNAVSPTKPAPFACRPKHLNVFAQSAKWCGIMGVNNAADISHLIEIKKMREFIRVNEALHDLSIAEIAKDIVRNGRRIVLVAGPSSSGKTTFAARLGIHLRVLGRSFIRVSMDDYYRNRDEIELEPDGTLDLEALKALDVPLLRSQLQALVRGEQVEIPRFNFQTGTREAKGVLTQLTEDQIVIVEGIHGLNPEISGEFDTVHHVFISAMTCLNVDDHNRIRTTDVRLLRRIVRDNAFRGTLPEKTIEMWDSVRQGEERWIFPYQEMADSVFNSTLHYELPVLKRASYHLLKNVDQEKYPIVKRLMSILECVPDFADDMMDEIPPLSLLREFVGGSTAEKE